jgi:hypothetical protein
VRAGGPLCQFANESPTGLERDFGDSSRVSAHGSGQASRMSKALVVLGAQWGDEGKVRIRRRNPSDRGISGKNMAHPFSGVRAD